MRMWSNPLTAYPTRAAALNTGLSWILEAVRRADLFDGDIRQLYVPAGFAERVLRRCSE